jgi:hypothetical protein
VPLRTRLAGAANSNAAQRRTEGVWSKRSSW